MRTREIIAVATLGAAALAAAAAGCSSEPAKTATQECEASSQAFVRKAFLAVLGRRPWGQAEVNAYEDLLNGLIAKGADRSVAKQLVVDTMTRDPAYLPHWEDFFMDALGVSRITAIRNGQYAEIQSKPCYGAPSSAPNLDGSLASWVRDNYPSTSNPDAGAFTLGDLLASSLVLDDVSPIYRANLFNLLALPIAGANVAPMDLERARRGDFGETFEQRYLQRDPTCMPCHNSESSVTYDPDPTKNRAWPLPGYFEKALYGASTGQGDPIRSRSIFRFTDVVVDGGKSPWGWNGNLCGTFEVPQDLDPLGVDAYFGTIHDTPDDPEQGKRVSVWALEDSLRRGVDALATSGLQLDGSQVKDPNQAFAYLVAASIAEQVWTEMVGTGLTIANHFPRTEAQRDILKSLADLFARSHFSLKALIGAVATRPEFNLKAPDEGCGDSLYSLPRVFDPWTSSETDASRRGNSPADDVHPLSGRVLVRSLHTALNWPTLPAFPDAPDQPFQAGIGLFLQKAQPGFRGLDFQARLWWEQAYGHCEPRSSDDFITLLVQREKATQGATVGDAVIALKDRLIGDPSIADAEKPALEQLLGTTLDQRQFPQLDSGLRRVCGVYVSSPQFLLGGLAPRDSRVVPRLTDPDHTYERVCAALAGSFESGTYQVSCGGDGITVSLR